LSSSRWCGSPIEYAKAENMGRKNVVLLASCFCLFTLAQTARPLESIAFFSHPVVAAKYQQLTRHTLEEIGGRVADLSAGATLEFGILTAKAPVRSSRVNQVNVPVWPVYKVVHRRILPSAPDGAH
jgi:hypothetical protein